MIAKVLTASTLGLVAQLIEVEIDLSPALPSVVMVGLPDKAVQESKERIRSSLKESGFEFPVGKVTINLAPADIIKTGTAFDLPIALGILKLTGYIKTDLPDQTLFLGELSLDGRLRPASGVLTICLWAKNHGFKQVFLPASNSDEAALVRDIDIYPVETLKQIVEHLNRVKPIEALQSIDVSSLYDDQLKSLDTNGLYQNDMAYVRGQSIAKRALEIAASGGHNVLFIGVPGSGKTLLARSYPTILPRMTEGEILEVTQVYSVANQLRDQSIMLERPFRAPHHSASHIALVGGGSKLRPGEISLAHRGVLFLDEFPEFSRDTIEALRQPLEDGFVTISRASGSLTYPARFYLLAAANPTPSGYFANDVEQTHRPQSQLAIARYQAKFSGPIMDRIDLQVAVNRPAHDELQTQDLSESSKKIAERVQNARDIQTKRYINEKIFTNGEMSLPLIQKYCVLNSASELILAQAVEKFKLSPRGYMRILKVSRTIADLEGREMIETSDVAEALQYRGKF